MTYNDQENRSNRRRRKLSRSEAHQRDRHKQSEERKKVRRRRKAHKRRMRKRRWAEMKDSFSSIFRSSPEQLKRRRSRKALKKRIRKERADERRKKVRNLAYSLGLRKKRITSEDIIRRKIREDRRNEAKQAIISFLKNPLPKKRKKDLDEIVIKRKIKEDRVNSVIESIRSFFSTLSQIFKNPELRSKFGIMLLNSTSMYILSFLLLYFLYNLITMLVAASFNIPTIFQYYKLTFPISTYSNLWTRPALVVIFASGPLLSLTISLVLLKAFFIKNQFIKYFRLLILWTILHGINMFFGAYIVGMITRTGFIYTSEWIFYSSKFDIEEIIFSLIAFFMLVITGRYVVRLFLMTSLSRSLIRPGFRLFYLLSKAVLPWLFGSLILFLVFMPNNTPFVYLFYVTMFIMVVQVLIKFNSVFNERVIPLQLSRRIVFHWISFILMIALLISIRLGLEDGWSFMV